MLRITSVAVVAALALFAPDALAQSRPVGVRIVAVKAKLLPPDAQAPEVPDELAPHAETLTALPPPARYELLGQSTKRAAPGGELVFALPREHQADVVVSIGRGERPFDLRMVITRPAAPDPAAREQKPERVRVLAHEVAAEDGATYVVRVVDAFGKGEHLLLLVTVGTGELD